MVDGGQNAGSDVAQRQGGGGSEDWGRMVVVFAVRSACDRAWAYFLPLLLSTIAFEQGKTSLLAGSAGLYATRTAVEIAALPVASRVWRGTSKHVALFLAAEHAFLIASAAALLTLKERSSTEAQSLPLLAVCGVTMAIEASLSKTLWNAVEKQQTAVMSMRGSTAPGAPQLRLAAANAQLSRIDLTVGALTPFAVAWFNSKLGVERLLVFLVSLQVFGAAVVAPWLVRTCAEPGQCSQAEDEPAQKGATFVEAGDGVRLVVIAHALLHFTVVSPSGLLLVWLRQHELPESHITNFVAAAQVRMVRHMTLCSVPQRQFMRFEGTHTQSEDRQTDRQTEKHTQWRVRARTRTRTHARTRTPHTHTRTTRHEIMATTVVWCPRLMGPGCSSPAKRRSTRNRRSHSPGHAHISRCRRGGGGKLG